MYDAGYEDANGKARRRCQSRGVATCSRELRARKGAAVCEKGAPVYVYVSACDRMVMIMSRRVSAPELTAPELTWCRRLYLVFS